MKRAVFTVLTVLILSVSQIAFAETTTKPPVKTTTDVQKKTDPERENKLYYYDAISSLKRAKTELGKVSGNFEESERDNAVKTIDQALKQLEATMAKHK